MSTIKSRNWSKEENQMLAFIVQSQQQLGKLTWNEIAIEMNKQNPSFNKTGKQCRERWTNQLNPEVKRNSEWSAQENQILFSFHEKQGNKWAQISASLPGRTDNCVKNHFYSTLRKGLRKVNNYIETIKRKSGLVKTFKNQILNKILLLSEGKYDSKFLFNQVAKQLALTIKRNLKKLALQDEQTEQFKEQIFQMISQFARNCRKKKTKKSNIALSSEESLNQPRQNPSQTSIIYQKSDNFLDQKKRAYQAPQDCFQPNQKKNIQVKTDSTIYLKNQLRPSDSNKKQNNKKVNFGCQDSVENVDRKKVEVTVLKKNSLSLCFQNNLNSPIPPNSMNCHNNDTNINFHQSIMPRGNSLKINNNGEIQEGDNDHNFILLAKNSFTEQNNVFAPMLNSQNFSKQYWFKNSMTGVPNRGFIHSLPQGNGSGFNFFPGFSSSMSGFMSNHGSGFSIFENTSQGSTANTFPKKKDFCLYQEPQQGSQIKGQQKNQAKQNNKASQRNFNFSEGFMTAYLTQMVVPNVAFTPNYIKVGQCERVNLESLSEQQKNMFQNNLQSSFQKFEQERNL